MHNPCRDFIGPRTMCSLCKEAAVDPWHYCRFHLDAIVGKTVRIVECDWTPWNGATGTVVEFREKLGQYRIIADADHVVGNIISGESLWLFPRELQEV